MNDDLENQLRGIPLARPPAGLDQRMDALFAGPPARAGSAILHAWAVLGLPAVGLAAALVLFLLHPEPPARQAARLVYRIEPQGLMRELLLTPPAHASAPPALELSVRL